MCIRIFLQKTFENISLVYTQHEELDIFTLSENNEGKQQRKLKWKEIFVFDEKCFLTNLKR